MYLPLPNEVIDLNELHKMKFYNLSYREYVCLYDKYIIGVYPFSIKIDYIPKDYNNFKLMGVRSSHHHQDFENGYINIDPCDVHYKINKKELSGDTFDDFLEAERDAFNSAIISHNRNKKLEDILK